jgi:hypothetical protein
MHSDELDSDHGTVAGRQTDLVPHDMTRSEYTLEKIKSLVDSSGSTFIGIEKGTTNSKGFYPKVSTFVTFKCCVDTCDTLVSKSIYALQTSHNTACEKHSRSIGKRKKIDEVRLLMDDMLDEVVEKVKSEESIEALSIEELIHEHNELELSIEEFFDATGFETDRYFDPSFLFTMNRNIWFQLPDTVIGSRSSILALLNAYFVENIDFRTNGDSLETKREVLKKLLIRMNTKKCDRIYDYLVEFDNRVTEYMRYQHECVVFNLQNKNKKTNTFSVDQEHDYRMKEKEIELQKESLKMKLLDLLF